MDNNNKLEIIKKEISEMLIRLSPGSNLNELNFQEAYNEVLKNSEIDVISTLKSIFSRENKDKLHFSLLEYQGKVITMLGEIRDMRISEITKGSFNTPENLKNRAKTTALIDLYSMLVKNL